MKRAVPDLCASTVNVTIRQIDSAAIARLAATASSNRGDATAAVDVVKPGVPEDRDMGLDPLKARRITHAEGFFGSFHRQYCGGRFGKDGNIKAKQLLMPDIPAICPRFPALYASAVASVASMGTKPGI